MKWYEINGNGHDVVISSRVRLARNLEDFPFTPKLDAETSEKIAEKVISALKTGLGEELTVTDMRDSDTPKRLLLEDHLVSPDFCADSPLARFLVTDSSGSLAVMINEEDHVRIQSIYPGFALEKAYETASHTDDVLAESVSLAFDETLGFLTACPTNLGTGLRASVMLHLPAMSAYGYIKSLAALMTKIGLTVRGMYGEGSEALGCLYQLSNQITLGISETDAIEKLEGAVKQIVAKERELRAQMLSDKNGDTAEPYSISAGLDYPGVGPAHANLYTSGRSDVLAINDDQALEAAYELTRTEGIIPALESAHALAVLPRYSFRKDSVVVVTVSGRGDKDMETYLKHFKGCPENR